MSDKRYRVIYNGNLALDTDEDQVRQNLAEKCRLSSQAIDKILAGENPVLKKGVDEATAQRYKDYLDRLGLLCDVVGEAAAKPQSNLLDEPPPLLTKEEAKIQTVSQPKGRTCPKCQAPNQGGDTCARCGLMFSRFEEVHKRRSQHPEPAAPKPAKGHFDHHPEQLFIGKAFGVILAILLLKELLGGLLFILFLVFPVGFLVYIRLQAAMNDQSATQLLAEHITFMPVMYSNEERAQEYIPKVAYSLIAVNILIFYLFEMNVNPQILWNNLIFLPYQPNLLNVPFSLFSAMFLHASQAHLWGNILFLWAVGTVVERRIGGPRFLLFYLICGVASHLVYLFFCLILGIPAHSLGASGAIAGVMGVFAVRCYFKSMVFPLPILGIFSLFLPISLKIRLNSLVIIGLFFLTNLSGGLQQAAGSNASGTNYLAHLGGMLCGILLALAFKLNEDAINERHIEIGSRAVNARIGTRVSGGEESLQRLLKKNPEDMEALLMLARLRTKHAATEEGEKLYRKVIPMLVRSKPEDAMIAYLEFDKLYLKPLDAPTMYRLANIFHRRQDHEMTARCLEMVCKDQDTPAQMLEKALFQCARTFEALGLVDAAKQYYQRCVDTSPDSALGAKAKIKLNLEKT